MEFYRIDENTIRCIVSSEEMDEYDLTLEMFLTHEGRADEFLHHVMQVASEEVGYENKSPLVSMRLEILPDNRISMIINSHDEEDLRDKLLERIKEISALHQKSKDKNHRDPAAKTEDSVAGSEVLAGHKFSKKSIAENVPYVLILTFTDLQQAIRYCKTAPVNQPVLSTLVKQNDRYILVIQKYRISLEKYGALAVTALEFSEKVEGSDVVPCFASVDDGNILIRDKAFLKLKKL